VPPLISDDAFKNDPRKEAAADYFLDVDVRLQPLIAQLNAFKVQPGSAFADDDKASRTDAVSHQARALLSVAADNALALRSVIVKAEVLPAFAGYSLTRNAIECAGVALWLMGPPSRDTRVLRALQLSRESLNDHRKLEATRAGQKHRRLAPTDPVLLKLEAERDKRAANVGVSLVAPSITERLEEAEMYVKRRADHQEALVVYWQRGSGLAHGRRHAVWQVSDARLRGSDHSGFQAVMSADIVEMTAHFEGAVNYLEDGIRMLERRGTAV
jgi:hypothetical protein